MSIALYMDQHVPRAVTVGLRLRNTDVLTASEDGASGLTDAELLDRASALGRVLFSQDDDLLAEARRRQAAGTPFGGVVYAHQLRVSIGACIRDLEIIASAGEQDDLRAQVLFLPLSPVSTATVSSSTLTRPATSLATARAAWHRGRGCDRGLTVAFRATLAAWVGCWQCQAACAVSVECVPYLLLR